MVFVIMTIWGGSLVSGWNGFWGWLLVPLAAMSLYVLNTSMQMRAMRERNGLPHPALGDINSMAGPNARLIAVNMAQNIVLFSLGMIAHWLVG